MIKHVITDLDGTLVDNLFLNTMSYRRAFESVGLKFDPYVYRQCFGLRFDAMCDMMGVPSDTALRQKIASKKAEAYAENIGMADINNPLVNFIKSLKDVTVTVATTASSKNAFAMLDHLQSVTGFVPHYVITGEDVKNGKPAPDVYLHALDMLGVTSRDEVMVFEDSMTGITAAHAAGIRSVIKIQF